MYPGHQSVYNSCESRTVKARYSKLTVSVLSWLSLLSTYYFAINKSKNETKQEQQKHLYFCTCFKTDPPCGDDVAHQYLHLKWIGNVPSYRLIFSWLKHTVTNNTVISFSIKIHWPWERAECQRKPRSQRHMQQINYLFSVLSCLCLL